MACLPWFKVFVGVPDHKKVTRLMALLNNPLADAYVVRLWNHCAAHQPEGVFPADSAAFEVERAVRWDGARGELFAAFVTTGLLDVCGDTVEVHDWKTEQGAHVAKAVKDAEKPDGRKGPKPRRSKTIPPQPIDTSSTSPPKIPRDIVDEVSRECRGESREKRVEKIQTPSESVGGANAPAQPASPVQRDIPGTEPSQADSREPTRADRAFAEWAAEEREPHLPPDAPRERKLQRHQWAKLGEALRGHGELLLQHAFRLYLTQEDPWPREHGFPLGHFVSEWPKWVRNAQADASRARAVGVSASSGAPSQPVKLVEM